MLNSPAEYIGRFAPSPTGPLHFGSLVAALASYLDARANNGIWLVRMEDLDPAREPAGSATKILDSLQYLGLSWDRPVLYQSQRLEAYSEILDQLSHCGRIYSCDCSRQQVRTMGGVYDGSCRQRKQAPTGQYALRVKVDDRIIKFEDVIQGPMEQDLFRETGDFVLLRKDKLFAYQIAVVVDDNFQKITHVVRGHDLLESTPRQLFLQGILGFRHPAYAHIPIATNADGEKLSKQRKAQAIDRKNLRSEVFSALQFLGQEPPATLAKDPVARQISWATRKWDIQTIPKQAHIFHQGAGK